MFGWCCVCLRGGLLLVRRCLVGFVGCKYGFVGL